VDLQPGLFLLRVLRRLGEDPSASNLDFVAGSVDWVPLSDRTRSPVRIYLTEPALISVFDLYSDYGMHVWQLDGTRREEAFLRALVAEIDERVDLAPRATRSMSMREGSGLEPDIV
jgi:hypothetical protein